MTRRITMASTHNETRYKNYNDALRGKKKRRQKFFKPSPMSEMSEWLCEKSYDFTKAINPDHKNVSLKEHKVQIISVLFLGLFCIGIFHWLRLLVDPEATIIVTVLIILGLGILLETAFIYYEVKKLNCRKR